MYEVSVRGKFDAAHYIRGYPGKCADLHGHTWRYSISIRGKKLDGLGMLVDFKGVKKLLESYIESRVDHAYLNVVLPDAGFNEHPTAENISKWIYDVIRRYLKELSNKSDLRLHRVEVWESDDCSVIYSEGL